MFKNTSVLKEREREGTSVYTENENKELVDQQIKFEYQSNNLLLLNLRVFIIIEFFLGDFFLSEMDKRVRGIKRGGKRMG